MATIRNNVEKLNQDREQGTLHHHQCIDELTSHLRNVQIQNAQSDDSKVVSPTRSETPTSFVTVIEVKDPSPIQSHPSSTSTSTSTSISIAAATSEIVEDIKPEPSYSPPALPQQDSNDEIQLDNKSSPAKNDENNVQPTQNIEVKRKIPPRYCVLNKKKNCFFHAVIDFSFVFDILPIVRYVNNKFCM